MDELENTTHSHLVMKKKRRMIPCVDDEKLLSTIQSWIDGIAKLQHTFSAHDGNLVEIISSSGRKLEELSEQLALEKESLQVSLYGVLSRRMFTLGQLQQKRVAECEDIIKRIQDELSVQEPGILQAITQLKAQEAEARGSLNTTEVNDL
jgi:hypothetical protein